MGRSDSAGVTSLGIVDGVGVSGESGPFRHNPVGVDWNFAPGSQGSRAAATLGYETERRWRSAAIARALAELLSPEGAVGVVQEALEKGGRRLVGIQRSGLHVRAFKGLSLLRTIWAVRPVDKRPTPSMQAFLSLVLDTDGSK